jgi:heavy metal sensor kinase
MRILPIRTRLTLWYGAMFASAAAVLCMASLWMLQRTVGETEYHDLQERAEDIQAILNREAPDRTLQQLQADLATIYEGKDDGKYLQVRDDQGAWLFRSKRMAAENPDLPAPDRLPSGGVTAEFHQGVHQVRVLAYPIANRGKRYSVQTGLALDKPMVLIADFRTRLLLLAPIVILLAAAAGHAMSSKALAPVAALAANARRINDRNLDTRLPTPNTNDEISDLSLTLNQMLERIDKAFASVRSFTGNASHELRTPIALLRTEIEVALYRPRKVEEYRATLGRLHEETVRMTTLIENLLSLARADGGAEAISLKPLSLAAILRKASETWAISMEQAMLDFRVRLPKESQFVLCDGDGVQRLLSILLENAMKYTPSGGTVTVFAEAEGDRISISVKDTGIGIPNEYGLRIFDRFFRGTPKGANSAGGSGLGLALGKWIADCHGTDLEVESAPGNGSSFSFLLKRAIPAGGTTVENKPSNKAPLELSTPPSAR